MLFRKRNDKGENEAKALLDASIQAWRDRAGDPESLSSTHRNEILRSIRTEGGAPGLLAPLASLFIPARRVAWAAGLPSVALLLVVGSLMYQPGGVVPGAAATLNVSRVGDEVVFEIANGGRAHRVFRADSPEVVANAESSEAFALAHNSFRDRLDSDSDIVFYRVD